MVRALIAVLLACGALVLLSASVSRRLPEPHPSGAASHILRTDWPPDATAPVLIVQGSDNPYSSYYPEILKAEGLNLYSAVQAQHLDADSLTGRRVVLLASARIPPTTVPALEQWVRDGGLVISMRPGPSLRPLLGVKRARPAIKGAYMLANASLNLSRGIVDEPIQIHGPADVFELVQPGEPGAELSEPAIEVAKLYASAIHELPNPAVTLRRIGQGYGAAFAFDLAGSVVLTRQGNPAWIDEERDGLPPRRPNDLFFPNHLDLQKIGIPQADEHQRLLANLILSAASAPMPRYWYLPNGRRAAIIMTGDDHAAKNGTAQLFARLAALSPPGCRPDLWECLRATAYLTPNTALEPAEAEAYQRMGFELGLHIDTRCINMDDPALSATVAAQLEKFQQKYPGLPKQTTHRIHCIVWNGWTDLASIQRQNGIRLDLNYYHWPPRWIETRAGFLTGSGFPMPFFQLDGSVLDIYQAASHLVDQSGVPQRQGINYMIERAIGPEQFFGAFGTHYDHSDDYDTLLIEAARHYDVPLITADQMLSWLNARNGSRFEQIEWRDATLRFVVRLGPGAKAASVTLPAVFKGADLSRVSCHGEPVAFTVQTIKGLDTAFFTTGSAACEAHYSTGETHASDSLLSDRGRS